MKHVYLIVLFFSLLSGKNVQAQDQGFTFLLGPSINVFYGSPKEDFSYTPPRLSWQFNGQVGFISTRGGTIRGNFFGIFASAGKTNPEMLLLMQNAGAEFSGDINMEKNFNEFYSVEAGMTIVRFLRLSAGLGRQGYTYDNDQHTVLKYFSGTIGVAFDLGSVNWVIDANLMTGKDLDQNIIRLSTGFMVKF